jgi:hypothetical protein
MLLAARAVAFGQPRAPVRIAVGLVAHAGLGRGSTTVNDATVDADVA